MTNFVNDVAYSPDHIFEILSIGDNESYTSGFGPKSNVGKLQFKDLEHGMMLKDETIIKRVTKNNHSDKESFYFLHMAKTSGISLQEELKDVFKEEQMFINTIQYVDDVDMLNSKLISGHFSMHPFNVFEKNNKKIHGITMVRNPIDRAISFFIFRYKIYDTLLGRKPEMPTSRHIDLFLYDIRNVDFINNFQTRSITSTLDIEQSSLISNKYINKSIDRFQLTGDMVSHCHFIKSGPSGNEWKNSLNKFDIIGTVDHRELFLNKLSNILEKNKYISSFKNIKKNVSNFEVEEIKKILTKDQINRITELNKYDFELYDFLMTNKGVFEC